MKFTKFIFFTILLFSSSCFSMFRLTSALKELSSRKSKISPMTIWGVTSAAATAYVYYKNQQKLEKTKITPEEKQKMLMNLVLPQDLRIFNEIKNIKNKQN